MQLFYASRQSTQQAKSWRSSTSSRYFYLGTIQFASSLHRVYYAYALSRLWCLVSLASTFRIRPLGQYHDLSPPRQGALRSLINGWGDLVLIPFLVLLIHPHLIFTRYLDIVLSLPHEPTSAHPLLLKRLICQPLHPAFLS